MKKFAALTGTRVHSGAILPPGYRPELGLGTIVQDPNGEYWLCLQASCDSVRLKEESAFLFAPLEQDEKSPEHVVPCRTSRIQISFIGLKVPSKGYTRTASFRFDPDSKTETVRAERRGKRGQLYFKSVTGRKFVWVADLKQRRALRTASAVGQQMSRPGFDEFEPFRSS